MVGKWLEARGGRLATVVPRHAGWPWQKSPLAIAVAAFVPALALHPAAAQTGAAATTDGITAVEGIRVGHFTYPDDPTGCTVVIAAQGTVGAADVRGGAPGTVETDLLDPVNSVQSVDAIFISGGSAFGLATRDGVVRYLEENGRGYPIPGVGVIPIVSGAIIFDLRVAQVRARPRLRLPGRRRRHHRARRGGERGRGRRRHRR